MPRSQLEGGYDLLGGMDLSLTLNAMLTELGVPVAVVCLLSFSSLLPDY